MLGLGDATGSHLIFLKHMQVNAARKKEAELKQGMDIFNMHQPPYKEMAMTEKEIEQLEAIYTVYQEWQDSYNGWKDGLFRDLKVNWSGQDMCDLWIGWQMIQNTHRAGDTAAVARYLAFGPAQCGTQQNITFYMPTVCTEPRAALFPVLASLTLLRLDCTRTRRLTRWRRRLWDTRSAS